MKMVKKILLGTLALAAVLAFTSCGTREEAGNSEMIQVNVGSKKASVDYTNESGDITRDFKSLQNQHSDAICKITTKINGNDCDGVMGYVFDYKDNGNDTVNFSIAALRIKKNGTKHYAGAYVETYQNVTKDSFTNGPRFKNTSGNDAVPVSKGGWTNYDDSPFGKKLNITENELENMITASEAAGKGKTVTFWVEVVGNLGSGVTGRSGDAGSYTVNFYKEDPERNKGAGNTLTYKEGVTPIDTATIDEQYTFTKFSDSLPQLEMGFYATVYAGQTLTGTWDFDEIRGEAEEIEE